MTASDPRNRRPARRQRRAFPVVLGALALLATVAGGYAVARQTAIFALQRIEVSGAPPTVAATVRETLRPYLGKSLVRFDAGDATRRIASVAEIADARFDRVFPHTLKVRVRTERPVAVLRQGSNAWLVSATARVVRPIERPYPRLPRIWLPQSTEIAVNTTLGGLGAQGVAALVPLGPLHIHAAVRQVRTGNGELTLVLGSGTELRLGDSGDLRLKLSIAKQLVSVTAGASYVDVTVPERPVANYNSQVVG